MRAANVVCVIAGSLAIIAPFLWYNAAFYEKELRSSAPISSIKASKDYGLFVAEFDVSPSVVDLGDTTYKIEEAWIVHEVTPVSFSPFVTVKRVLPEINLLVRVTDVARNPELTQSEI